LILKLLKAGEIFVEDAYLTKHVAVLFNYGGDKFKLGREAILATRYVDWRANAELRNKHGLVRIHAGENAACYPVPEY
jgi:hypothetical protein